METHYTLLQEPFHSGVHQITIDEDTGCKSIFLCRIIYQRVIMDRSETLFKEQQLKVS